MTEEHPARTTRRGLLAAAGGLAAGTAAVGTASAASYGGWFDDVSNFDGTVDRRGESEVRVEVGVQGNGGYYGFGPAAVRVDPGTTVVFEWTGRGQQHNVVQEPDRTYESELTAEAGFTFEHTYEEAGIHKYFCQPHRPLGMKGAVVVGDVPIEAPATGDAGGGFTLPGGEGLLTGLWVTVGTLALAVVAVLGGEAAGRARDIRAAEAETAGGVTEEALERDPERVLGHHEFDPSGTWALVLVYLLILIGLWVFMYFVEFLGNGPTVIG